MSVSLTAPSSILAVAANAARQTAIVQGSTTLEGAQHAHEQQTSQHTRRNEGRENTRGGVTRAVNRPRPLAAWLAHPPKR